MTDAQINFTVDDNAKELAKNKLEHGELSKRLREAVEEIAFGEELSRRSKLEERLDSLQDKRDELETEREQITAELEEVTSKIERVSDRLDDLQTQEDEYQGALEMLEDQLADGRNVFVGHGQVEKAAHIGEKEPEGVIDDLKDRNPSIPDHAFMQQMSTPKDWNGIGYEAGKGVSD